MVNEESKAHTKAAVIFANWQAPTASPQNQNKIT